MEMRSQGGLRPDSGAGALDFLTPSLMAAKPKSVLNLSPLLVFKIMSSVELLNGSDLKNVIKRVVMALFYLKAHLKTLLFSIAI